MIDANNSDHDLDPPTSSVPQIKQNQEGKNEVIKHSICGLTSDIKKLTEKQRGNSKATPQTLLEKAMDKSSTLVAGDLSNHEFISFIKQESIFLGG